MASKLGIKNVFGILSQVPCRPPPSFDPATAAEVWFMSLQDIADDDLIAAALAFARSSESDWWPALGKLLTFLPQRAQLVVTPEDANVEWGYLLEQLRKRGGRYNPPFVGSGPKPVGGWYLADDPIRRAALEAGLLAIGGWDALCNTTDEQIPAARAAFRKAYEATVARANRDREEGNIVALLEQRTGQKLLGGAR